MSKDKVTEEKEQKEVVESAETKAETDQVDAKETEAIQEETPSEDTAPSAEDQIKEANDKYMRIYSEFENFRRRTAREKLDLISTASEGVIKDIIPSLDDFDRALKTNEESGDLEALKEGMKLVHQKLHAALKAKGLQEMESQGKEFNIDEHEALTKIPAPADDLKGKVIDVIEKGYKLNDKVIRYAKVVVGE